MSNMTTHESNKIKSAIADCDRFISKEEKRSADLRPAETVKLLDWYKAHKTKLENMLVTGEMA